MEERFRSTLEAVSLHGTPEQKERVLYWKTAIGLQDVDALEPSPFLLRIALDHTRGSIDLAEAERQVERDVRERTKDGGIGNRSLEADLVPVHLVRLLCEDSFDLSPSAWRAIHQELFRGVFRHAGSYRTCNLTKREWALKGQTVAYTPWPHIPETVTYDLQREAGFSWQGLTAAEAIRHIADFIAGIWQIHPFREGNTRGTAVFLIRYLRSLGCPLRIDVFADHSWYFRNALVRASFEDRAGGIRPTPAFLIRFLENLLLDRGHALRNRDLHVDSRENTDVPLRTGGPRSPESCTLEECCLLRELERNPSLSQKRLAAALGKPERTIRERIAGLQKKGLLTRENGRRTGRWMVLSSLRT